MSSSETRSRNGKKASIELASTVPGTEFTVVAAGFQPVAYGVDRLAVDVSPGIYQVVARAGPAVDRRALDLKPGARYRDLGLQLEFPSVAPLAGTTGASEAHAALTAQASRLLAAEGPRSAGLIVVLRRAGDGGPPIARAEIGRLALLDSRLASRGDFADASTVSEDGRAVVWTASLPPGGYCLRALPASKDEPAIDQSVWLAAGWQTIVFLGTLPAGTVRPRASILMVRQDRPWDPEQPRAAQATELVAAGLAAGRGIVSDGIVALATDARSPSPVLGLLAAQALLISERGDLGRAEGLLNELDRLVPGHPDLLGTRWLLEEARAQEQGRAPNPADLGRSIPAASWPPILLASYHALIRLDAYRPGTIVSGSLAQHAAATLLPDDVWATWRPPAPPRPDELDAEGGEPGASQHSTRALAERLSSLDSNEALSEAAERVADYLSAVAELDEEDRLAQPPDPFELSLATQLPTKTVERAIREIALLPPPLAPPPSTQPPSQPEPRPRDQPQSPSRWPPTAGLSLALAGVLVAGALLGWQVNELAGAEATPQPSLVPQPMPQIQADRVLSFGERTQDVPTRQQLRIGNGGTGDLTVTELTLSGEDAGAFVVRPPCQGTTIPGGGECAARIVFQPTRPGLHVAEVQIVSNQLEPYSVVLLGTGRQPGTPRIETSPLVNFGEVLQRAGIVPQGVPQDLTITNVGRGALTITPPTIDPADGGFRLVADTCSGQPLARDEPCTLSLFFSPLRFGLHVAEIDIVPDQGEPVTVALVGMGLQQPGAVFLLNAVESGPTVVDRLDFGLVASSDFEYLTVLANRSVTIAEREPALDTPGFAVDTNCLLRRLDAGQTCDLIVTFAPSSDGSYEMPFELISETGERYLLTVTGASNFPD